MSEFTGWQILCMQENEAEIPQVYKYYCSFFMVIHNFSDSFMVHGIPICIVWLLEHMYMYSQVHSSWVSVCCLFFITLSPPKGFNICHLLVLLVLEIVFFHVYIHILKLRHTVQKIKQFSLLQVRFTLVLWFPVLYHLLHYMLVLCQCLCLCACGGLTECMFSLPLQP